MRYIPILLFSFFSLCYYASLSQNKPESSSRLNPSIKLEIFPSIPAEIEGCSGYYTYTTTAISKEQYIFLTKTEEFAIIRINGNNLTLKMVTNTQPTKGIYKEVYKNNGYTATLTTKEVKETGDEGSIDTGTLEITYGATTLIVKIHGKNGC